MNFKSYLEIGSHQIEEELEKILSEFLSDAKKTNTKLIPFALALLSSCKGGKRIRGVLVKLGYEITSANWKVQSGKLDRELDREIIKVGAAYEILHTAILIHDDIIDRSALRRGQTSLYKALGGGHYGISQAISLGDIGLYLPIKIIASSSFSNEHKIKALKHLSEVIINTGWGEILDVELPHQNLPSEEDIALLQNLKTAQYTISGPLILGAILAGAKSDLAGVRKNLIKLLREFGEAAGIAFQIQDDILDGEALDETKSKGLEYVSGAKKMIPKITDDKRMRILLEEMTEYLVERTK